MGCLQKAQARGDIPPVYSGDNAVRVLCGVKNNLVKQVISKIVINESGSSLSIDGSCGGGAGIIKAKNENNQ